MLALVAIKTRLSYTEEQPAERSRQRGIWKSITAPSFMVLDADRSFLFGTSHARETRHPRFARSNIQWSYPSWASRHRNRIVADGCTAPTVLLLLRAGQEKSFRGTGFEDTKPLSTIQHRCDTRPASSRPSVPVSLLSAPQHRQRQCTMHFQAFFAPRDAGLQ